MHGRMVRSIALLAGHIGGTVPQKVLGAEASDAETLGLNNSTLVQSSHAGETATITSVMHRFWAHGAPRGRVWLWRLVVSGRRWCRLTAGWFGGNTDRRFGGGLLQIWVLQNLTGGLSNGDLSFSEDQELFKGKFWELVSFKVGGFRLTHLFGPIYC